MDHLLMKLQFEEETGPLLSPQSFLFHSRYDFCTDVYAEVKLQAEALLTGVLRKSSGLMCTNATDPQGGFLLVQTELQMGHVTSWLLYFTTACPNTLRLCTLWRV